MDTMGDLMAALDASPTSDPSSKSNAANDASRMAEVKAWLVCQFEAAGRNVPTFEFTPRVVAHLHSMASLSQARSRAASIVAADLRLKASDYRAEAVRIREILERVGLSREQLSPGAIGSAQIVAGVANLLNIRDTEMSSFLVAMGDLSLRKADVEERRAKVQKESKVLLEYTRKAIAKLNDLKNLFGTNSHKNSILILQEKRILKNLRTLAKFENEVGMHEAQMLQWQTNLAILDSKERQYMLQLNNYKAILNRVGYTSDINHGVLMEMAEHKKDLEKKTKPVLDTLRSYQDLPPDKTLAALAIEEKKRQFAAAEKYLEEVLQSALTTSEI